MNSYLTINRKFLMVVLLTLLVLFFQLVSIKGAPIHLEYMGLALLIFLFVKSPKIDLLAIIMFLLPSNQYINIGSTSIITTIITVYFLKQFLLSKRAIHIPLLLIGIILIGYSTIFGSLSTIVIAIKIFLYLFFCIDVFVDPNNNAKQKYIIGIKFLVLGIIVSACISMLLQPEIFNARFTLAPGQSTNTLGILAGFAIGCILMLIQVTHIEIKSIWLYSIFPLAAVGFLTQSRSFVFTVVIAVMWCLFYSLSRLKKIKNYKFIFALVVIGVLFFIIMSSNGQWNEVINNALDRILNPSNDDISNARFDLWSYYLKDFSQNKHILFFGRGTTISSDLMYVAHNLWIEQLYLFGIIGNIIVILMFGISIKQIYKKSNIEKLSFYGWLPLVIIFASSFFSHTFVAGADTIRFFLAVLAVGAFANNSNAIATKRINEIGYKRSEGHEVISNY